MKKHFIAMILASILVSPMAVATESYGGLSYGIVQLNGDFEPATGNLGIVFGGVNDAGFGFELFYSITVVDDSDSAGSLKSSIETDTLGLYAVYQTGGDIYFKAKAGYGTVFLNWDLIDNDNDVSTKLDDTFDGFSYGLSVGKMIGDGALELTYYRFPDLEDFNDLDDAVNEALGGNQDVSIESDIEMLNLMYVWTF